MNAPRVLRAGERGILLEFATLAEAVGWRAALDRAPIAGVTDAVSGARTVLLRFDPALAERAAIASAAQALVPAAGLAATGAAVDVPVVYDGPDLAETAALLDLAPRDLVELHTSRRWVCAFGGFAPGFGYLVSDGPALDVPRLPAPRTRVPAGAVGLAGEFSGIYPRESPGGWRLIGRTTLPMWSLERMPPATLAVGTAVRFVEVPR